MTDSDAAVAAEQGGQVTIDSDADGYWANPYSQYRVLRDAAPVHQHPNGPWMVFRYADVLRVLRDEDLSIREVHAANTPRNQMITSVLGSNYLYRPTMTRADAPEHTRYRRLLSRPFTPRSVAQLRPRVDAIVARLFEGAGDLREVELISEVARPLAYRVTSELLGAPTGGDEQLLLESSHAATVALMEPFPTEDQLRTATRATQVLYEVAAEVVAAKRDHLGDDVLSLLIAAGSDGTLDEHEVVTLVSMLFTAGHQTTYSAIGLAVLALLRNRSQWQQLCDEPELLTNAVEECLRYDNTIQLAWRTTPKEYLIGDCRIPEGVHVLGWTGSANRDPDQWGADVDSLNIRREGLQGHVSFGSGPHLCIGAWLARIEIQSVLSHLSRHFPAVELAENEPEWRKLLSLRGPERLLVQLVN